MPNPGAITIAIAMVQYLTFEFFCFHVCLVFFFVLLDEMASVHSFGRINRNHIMDGQLVG